MIHELKMLPTYFGAVQRGTKTFEVRRNDRAYALGDILNLKEYDPDKGYSGAEIRKRVNYMLADPQYCKEGYVILGIGSVQEVERVTDTVNKQALRDIVAAYTSDGTDAQASSKMVKIARDELTRLEALPTPSTPVQGCREALEELEQLKQVLTVKDDTIRTLERMLSDQALSQTDIQPSGWIPVSTQAVPGDGLYIVTDGSTSTYGHWSGGIGTITHWMPLPKPPGINSTEDDQPGRSITRKYAIKLGDEYMRERHGADCFTDDLGCAILFHSREAARHALMGKEYIAEIEVDEEGGLYDPSTEEEETDVEAP